MLKRVLAFDVGIRNLGVGHFAFRNADGRLFARDTQVLQLDAFDILLENGCTVRNSQRIPAQRLFPMLLKSLHARVPARPTEQEGRNLSATARAHGVDAVVVEMQPMKHGQKLALAAYVISTFFSTLFLLRSVPGVAAPHVVVQHAMTKFQVRAALGAASGTRARGAYLRLNVPGDGALAAPMRGRRGRASERIAPNHATGEHRANKKLSEKYGDMFFEGVADSPLKEAYKNSARRHDMTDALLLAGYYALTCPGAAAPPPEPLVELGAASADAASEDEDAQPEPAPRAPKKRKRRAAPELHVEVAVDPALPRPAKKARSRKPRVPPATAIADRDSDDDVVYVDLTGT